MLYGWIPGPRVGKWIGMLDLYLLNKPYWFLGVWLVGLVWGGGRGGVPVGWVSLTWVVQVGGCLIYGIPTSLPSSVK